MITASCPRCDAEVALPDTAAGNRAECPQCGHVFRLPDCPDPPDAGRPARLEALAGALRRRVPVSLTLQPAARGKKTPGAVHLTPLDRLILRNLSAEPVTPSRLARLCNHSEDRYFGQRLRRLVREGLVCHELEGYSLAPPRPEEPSDLGGDLLEALAEAGAPLNEGQLGARTGYDVDADFNRALRALGRRGLVERSPGGWAVTAEGRAHLKR